MPDQNLPDAGWLFAVGSFFAGVLGLKGYDRMRGGSEQENEDKLLKATLAISSAIREEHGKTRTAIYESAREQDKALQAIANAQARLDGQLSRERNN